MQDYVVIVIEIVIHLNILVQNYFFVKIHPALLRKDNYFKTVPIGKLVKILALWCSIENRQQKIIFDQPI